MTRLSVNINKVATLRNARGGAVPSVVEAASKIQSYGAQGITVHPRPDERHITYADVHALVPAVYTEFNIEGYPERKWLDLVIEAHPTQATLVPDPPGVLTSNAGWDTRNQAAKLKEVIAELKSHGIRTSIFIEPNPADAEGAADVGADRVELYTESYASAYSKGRERAIAPFIETAKAAHQAGLGINAGHDLNLDNLGYFAENIPNLDEVSIGHALIADALYFGLENTVQMYLLKLK